MSGTIVCHLIRYICRLLMLLRGHLHLLYFSFYGFMLMVLCLCFKATRKCFNTLVGLRQCLLLFVLFLLLLYDTVCEVYK